MIDIRRIFTRTYELPTAPEPRRPVTPTVEDRARFHQWYAEMAAARNPETRHLVVWSVEARRLYTLYRADVNALDVNALRIVNPDANGWHEAVAYRPAVGDVIGWHYPYRRENAYEAIAQVVE